VPTGEIGLPYKNSYLFVRKETAQMLYLPREEGQGLVEYALILTLVAIVVIAVLMLLGPVIGNVFSNIVKAISLT
jgi:pilus assembly protein Flp/PilA